MAHSNARALCFVANSRSAGGYQSVEVVAKGRRRGSSDLVDDLPGKRDGTANDSTRLSGTAHITPTENPPTEPASLALVRLISGEALGNIYADPQITIPLLPVLERAPVPVGRVHFTLEQASDKH